MKPFVCKLSFKENNICYIIGIKSYILKLIRQIDDKINGCSSEHYTPITQQLFRERPSKVDNG